MRSQNNFQIESSRFRHFGSFKVISKALDASSGESVPSETIDQTLDVWFSYLSGSGLRMGEEFKQEVQKGQWEIVSSANKIVFRFLQDLEDGFIESSKEIKLTHESKDYSLVNLLNVSGESIYHLAEIQRIEQ